MKIERDDIIFGLVALMLLSVWFLSLLLFDSPITSILILWIGMSILSTSYVYVYKKRKRDKKVLRIRFFVSAIPIYPLLIYYIYKLVVDKNLPQGLVYLPFIIIFTVLALNAIVLYFYEIRKK